MRTSRSTLDTGGCNQNPVLVLGDPKKYAPVLRGSGYLGYVDSNQGEKKTYKWVICPLTRVINLHITSY